MRSPGTPTSRQGTPKAKAQPKQAAGAAGKEAANAEEVEDDDNEEGYDAAATEPTKLEPPRGNGALVVAAPPA